MTDERRFIFISYASDDEDKMLPIVEYLESRNLSCWYAPRNIPPGENYPIRIAEDLQKAGAVLVLITEKVGESQYVPKEVNRAIDYMKFVIPVLVDGSPIPTSLELDLGNIQHVDLQEEGFENLATYLETLLGRELSLEIKQPQSFKRLEVVSEISNVLLYRTHPDTLRKTNQLFVPPPGFEKMVQLLDEHHFLYLHHPQHTGKYSTALVLLLRLGIDEVYEWSKDTTFNHVFQHPIRQRAGYLIESDPHQFFQSASESMLDSYVKQLKEKQSFFLFIGTDDPGNHFFFAYSFKVDPPEDRERLLLNHVEEEDQTLQDRISQWIKEQAVKDNLPAMSQPREVKEIIKRIKKLVCGEINEQAFIRSLRENAKARVKNWFKEKRSLEEIAFYLTISLLQGQPYDVIMMRADQLASILSEKLGNERDKKLHNTIRDLYLEMFDAEVKVSWKQSEEGREQQEQVYLSSETDATYIWEFVWEQLPAYREPVKEWLSQLLVEGNSQIEKQVSDIVLTLLKQDFSSVKNILIVPWAKSKYKKEQSLVIRMLETLSLDPDWSHVVFRLIQSWLRQKDNIPLCWTAVTLLGSQAGVLYFSQSLKLLQEAYDANGYKLGYAIRSSLQNLSSLPLQDRNYEQIFYHFWVNWFKQKTSNRKKWYLYQFAVTVFQSNPALFLETTLDAALEFWCLFIRTCYQHYIPRKTVDVLLEQWVRAASGNPAQVKQLATLLARVYQDGDERVKSRLTRFLQRGLRNNEELYLPYKQILGRKGN